MAWGGKTGEADHAGIKWAKRTQFPADACGYKQSQFPGLFTISPSRFNMAGA